MWASNALTYSFVGPASSFSTDPAFGYGQPRSEPWEPERASFGGSVESATASVLSEWSAVANVSFTLVPDLQGSCGDLRFGFTDIGEAHAEAFSPAIGAGGDVWFSYTEQFRPFGEGSYNYLALLHETGHALGLKHPFGASAANGAVLPATLDSQSHTVMSYSALAGSVGSDFSYRPTTPMVLDILAIQHLYGANMGHRADATWYRFTEGGNYHETIWDAGGRDTISYEGQDACIIDLRQGAGSMMGNPIYLLDSRGAMRGAISNVWIAYGAQIENAASGDGNDRVTGNELPNILAAGAGDDVVAGGGGNDRIDGGGGLDLAVFSGPSADYVVTFNAATGCYAVGDRNRARDGVDVVSQAEFFQFSDAALQRDQLPVAERVSGSAFAVIAVSEALFGFGPGAQQFDAAMAVVWSGGASRFALDMGRGFAQMDSAALSAMVLGNLGISAATLGGGNPDTSFALLHGALTDVFSVYSEACGQVVLNLGNILAGLEADPVYGTAAAAFQNRLAGDFTAVAVSAVGIAPQDGAGSAG